MGQTTCFFSAGDPSGDNASYYLIKELRALKPELKLSGLGGPRMKKLGQVQLADPADLAVLGFWEVAKRFFFFKRLLKKCIEEIEQTKPNVIILVDYPGFNLRLAKAIKHLNIPIVYYISPQIWAWKKNRIYQIKKNIDLMLLILPFETDIYEQHNMTHEMIGHYLLEEIPDEYISSSSPENRQIALLPGSRGQELERMFKTMLDSVELMQQDSEVTAVVAAVRGLYDYEAAVKASGAKNVAIVYNDARRVVYESELVLTASGTATLECGLIGRPMVVVYKTGWITYQIAKRLVTLKNIALVNLVLGESILPELIQGAANPEQIVSELKRFLNDKEYYKDTIERLTNLPDILGGTGASKRAAEAIVRSIR